MPPTEDRELIRRAQQGDRQAFEDLVRVYRDYIFSLGYRLSGDLVEADELAQETFIAVYRSLRGFRFDSAFSTWLYGVAFNVYRNLRRSAHAARRVSNSQPAWMEPAARTGDPEARFLQWESTRVLQEKLGALPEEFKAVVILRDIQGFSYEEISSILSEKLGTIKSRVHRGRIRLQAALKEGDPPGNLEGVSRHQGAMSDGPPSHGT